MKTVEDKINTLGAIVRNLHARVSRLEILQGLIELPEEWGITDDRIIEIMEREGIEWETAKQRLVLNFGINEDTGVFFKVKIVHGQTWYEDCVGEVVEVVNWGDGYVMYEDYQLGSSKPWRHLKKEDVELVKEEEE